jgi:hypothetical protein
MRQNFRSSRFTHSTPAGLPPGIPGMGELIDITMQQAPQPGLHEASSVLVMEKV